MVRPHVKKITTGVKLREDDARLAFLKEDEIECIREIAHYEMLKRKYAKYPKIAFEITDEIEKAKDGLQLTRTHIRVLEEQIRLGKRVGGHR